MFAIWFHTDWDHYKMTPSCLSFSAKGIFNLQTDDKRNRFLFQMSPEVLPLKTECNDNENCPRI